MMTWLKSVLLTLCVPCTLLADQFTLFDETFTFEAKDAIATESHLFVRDAKKIAHWPKDWTYPIDYRNGTVHIRIEVLEKPAGGEFTHWSLCYIGNKSAFYGKAGYGCTGSPSYTTEGVYEMTAKMNEFWHNQYIDWTQGLKECSLVIKTKPKPGDNGRSHAHFNDLSKFFPTKVRIRLVQVAAGKKFNPDLVKPTQKQTATVPSVRKYRPIAPITNSR